MSNSVSKWNKEDSWNNGAITLQDGCGQHVDMDGLMCHFGLEELLASEESGCKGESAHWKEEAIVYLNSCS